MIILMLCSLGRNCYFSDQGAPTWDAKHPQPVLKVLGVLSVKTGGEVVRAVSNSRKPLSDIYSDRYLHIFTTDWKGLPLRESPLLL